VLVACLLLFALGSLCTASAHDLHLAVTGRGMQGIGVGGLVPATLALVADLWPPERRGTPLGVVGAVQETGTVLGPLYGGVILAVSGWRTVFWANLVTAVVLAAGLVTLSRPNSGSPVRGKPPAAAVLAPFATAGLVLTITAPAALTEHVILGRVYLPTIAGAPWSSPIAIVTATTVAVLATRLLDRPSVRRLVVETDLLGAGLLALALAGVVLAFSTADPARQVASDHAPAMLAVSTACAVLFVARQRRAAHSLVPPRSLHERAAKGALVVNVFVGAALVAALVSVPVFARATRFPGSELGASLILAQLLVALPVGALAGGCQADVPHAPWRAQGWGWLPWAS
jgi:MFS family permease